MKTFIFEPQENVIVGNFEIEATDHLDAVSGLEFELQMNDEWKVAIKYLLNKKVFVEAFFKNVYMETFLCIYD